MGIALIVVALIVTAVVVVGGGSFVYFAHKAETEIL